MVQIAETMIPDTVVNNDLVSIEVKASAYNGCYSNIDFIPSQKGMYYFHVTHLKGTVETDTMIVR